MVAQIQQFCREALAFYQRDAITQTAVKLITSVAITTIMIHSLHHLNVKSSLMLGSVTLLAVGLNPHLNTLNISAALIATYVFSLVLSHGNTDRCLPCAIVGGMGSIASLILSYSSFVQQNLANGNFGMNQKIIDLTNWTRGHLGI